MSQCLDLMVKKWARKDLPVLGFFPSKPSTKRINIQFQ